MSLRGPAARTLFLGGLMVAAACMDVAGPHALRHVALDIYPVFSTRSGGGAGDADSFVIVISNPPFPDTTIRRKIEPGQDTIQLAVQTTVSGSSADTIAVAFDGFSSLSGLHLYAGTTSIEVLAGTPTVSAPVPASYVGPGNRVEHLALSPNPPPTQQVGGQIPFTISALDSSDAAMPPDSVPVAFITRNANVVSVDGTGLAKALANGQTWVIAQSIAHASVRDSAQVTVAPQAPPAIALSAMSATFTDTVGNPNPPDQTINVTNGGGGTLAGLAVGTISYGAGGSGWLTATLAASAAPTSLTLHVSPAAAGLAAGQYTATVPITATGAGNSPQTVSVTLTVLGSPAIGLSSTSVAFADTMLHATPTDQTVSVSNTGAGTLSGLAVGTITYGTATGWLTASLNSSTAPATLTLHVTPGSLVAGHYTATVPVTSAQASNSPQNVSITLDVVQLPGIALQFTSTTFTDTIGNAAPPNQAVGVVNVGGGTLTGLSVGTVSYGVGATGWLTASLNQSTAPATLTLHVTPGAIAAGTYTASVDVSAPNASFSPQTMNVTLNVVNAPLGSITIAPGSVVMLPTGGQSLVVTAQATNGTVIATPALTWTSRNTGVATVNSSGSVIGVAGGTAVIVADAGGGIADSILVAVAGSGQAVVSAISDARAFDRVKAGDTVRVLVAVDLRNVAGGNVGSYTAQVTWNTAQLSFVRADTVSGGFAGPTVNSDSTNLGQLRFGAANPNGYTGPQVGLLNITFVAAASGATPVTLALTDLTEAGTFTNLLTQAIIVWSTVAVQ